MQQKQKFRFVSRIAALVIASAMLWACNNEAPKTEEPKTDAAAPADVIDTTKKDTVPVDTNAVQKPDGSH
jgi:hypothetical protein